MTAEDVRKLVESATRPFREKAIKAEAREKAFELLEAVTLPQQAKKRIVERVIDDLDVSRDLDHKKLAEAVAEEAKAEGEYLASVTGSGRVIGMGSAPVTVKPKEAKRLKEAEKQAKKDARGIFEELMDNKEAAKIAAKGRVA